MVFRHNKGGITTPFTKNFNDISAASLNNRGWFVQSSDTTFWNRRGEKAGQMTLFTLRGDNWPNTREKIGIRNLLLRKITSGCFEVEIHFADFIPDQNWQQSEILLLEDTSFTGKGIRLSVAYNDFSGGYHKQKEIIIQAITSSEKIMENRKKSLISQLFFSIVFFYISFLYAGGSVSNPAFKEVIMHEFDMNPHYIGLFAIKGFVDSAEIIPVHFTFFRLKENDCY